MSLIELLQAFILGITQGLTEFIPVSSSGHLILVGQALGFEHSGLAFDIALDIGTLAALFLFFRTDIKHLTMGLVTHTEHSHLSWLMAAATIPAIAAGVVLQPYAETVFRSTALVAINLIWVGLLMLMVDRLARRNVHLSGITLPKALTIGFAQCLALVPGVSRSGITISAGLLSGLTGEAATRFSFLLSAPIIFGATAKVMLEPENIQQLTAEPLLYAVGILGAFISGYWAIRFMISYLARHGLRVFAYYRIIIGVIILAIGVQ